MNSPFYIEIKKKYFYFLLFFNRFHRNGIFLFNIGLGKDPTWEYLGKPLKVYWSFAKIW